MPHRLALARFSIALPLVAVVLGAVAILGWLTGSTGLVQVLPGQPPMQFNTALCFILLGGAVAGLTHWPRALLIAIALLVAALVGATLAQYVLQTSFGIDQLFWRHVIVTATSHPGRMAPTTAVAFLLVCLAVALAALRLPDAWRSAAVGLLGLIVATLGLNTLAEVALRIAPGLLLGRYTAMAVHTAAGMLMLGSALLLHSLPGGRWTHTERLRWIPLIAFAAVIVFPANIWFALRDSEREHLRENARQIAWEAATLVELNINTPVRALGHMAARWTLYANEQSGGLPARERWQPDADNFLHSYPSLRAIVLADSDSRVLLRHSLGPAPGLQVGGMAAYNNERQPVFAEVRNMRQARLSQPLRLVNGDHGALIVVPAIAGNRLAGFVMAGVAYRDTLQRILSQVDPGYAIRIRDGDKTIYSRDAESPVTLVNSLAEARVALHGREWRIETWPKPSTVGSFGAPIPWLVLASGLLTALLVAVTLRMALEARWQAAQARELASRVGREAEHRRLADQGRLLAETRYTRLLERSSQGVVTLDRFGLIVDANNRLLQFLARPAEVVINTRLTGYVTEIDRERLQQALTKVDAGEESIETALVRPDGSLTPVLMAVSRLADVPADSAIRSLVLVTDIADIKAKETQLKFSLARFEAVARATSDAIWDWDFGANLVWWNDGFESLFGYRRDAIEPGPESWTNRIHPEDHDRIVDSIHAVIEGPGNHWMGEYRFRHADGRWLEVQDRGIVVRDAQGKAVRMVGGMTDITPAKESERRIKEALQRLEASNRELEEFAFVASHDLQEPLRKIRAFTTRAMDRLGDGIDGDSRDDLRRVENAAERMQQLLAALLAYSRVATKARPHERVDLNSVVDAVSDDLADQVARTGGRIERGDLPAIQGDPTQMRQLFQNLISNGLKFHRADVPPVVSIRAGDTPPGDGRPRTILIIEDNGIGFEEKYAERIFVPFQRLHERGSYEGSGMGLAIVRKIVERHGGKVRAISRPGMGAHFEIELPLAASVEQG